jgi:hypothetical protein
LVSGAVRAGAGKIIGAHSRLPELADNSGYTLTDKDGTVYEFKHVLGG